MNTRLSETAPAPGSEEGFQSFLRVFGAAAADYTDAELRQFYRDMLVLADILIELFLERHPANETSDV
jgi:hypothetical protein